MKKIVKLVILTFLISIISIFYSNVNAELAQETTSEISNNDYTLITEAKISKVEDKIYSGNKIEQDIILKFNDKELIENKDYTISYNNNENVGTASIKIEGIGNFTGTKEITFEILQKSIEDIQVINLPNEVYTTEKITPTLNIKYGNKKLVPGVDYIAEYTDNINVGEAKIVVKGIGNYTGERIINFSILQQNISNLVFESIAPQGYTGDEITPKIKAVHNGTVLIEDVDYVLSYNNNIKFGDAIVIIKGIGNYSGTRTITFKILKNIATAKVSGIKNKTYTGSKQTQSLTVKYGSSKLENGKDYTISYSNNVNAGKATITITGKGDFAGTKKVTFKISKRNITKLTFSNVKNYKYTGKSIKPSVIIKHGKKTLIKDRDYTVSYSKNINVGTATIIITGKGNYSGTKKITFKINKRNITSTIIDGLKSKTYTGSKQYQNLTITYKGITLKKDTHYTLAYKNNVKAGTATVTINGKGNFKGSIKLKYKIKDKDISTLTIKAASSLIYTGNPRKPKVTVKCGSTTLIKGTDYTLKYSNNVKSGTGQIIVTGKGNYTGTKKLTFKITQRNISDVTINGLTSKIYTGSKLTQKLKLTYSKKTLKNGTDYTLAYENNVEVGTATIIITGKGNFTGTKKLIYNINKRSIEGLTFSKIKNYTYNGKEITPTVTVKYGNKTLEKDIDYTLSYKNNIKVGTATIILTGKGNYTGTKKIKFEIKNKEYYIKVNYKANVVTIYEKGISGKYDVPVKAMLCSTGTYTPKSGKYAIKSRWKWLRLYGGVYGHYTTQITGDILFHSVPYLEKSTDTLKYWEYDKLGTSASLGCVRLTAIDAKWIYDNISRGTIVEFYASKDPGPLGKPEAMKISDYEEYRNWDPTDPNSKNPWKEIL